MYNTLTAENAQQLYNNAVHSGNSAQAVSYKQKAYNLFGMVLHDAPPKPKAEPKPKE